MAGISCGFMPLGGGTGVDWKRRAALVTIEKVFREIDSDHDGRIKVESFVTFMMLNGVTVTEIDRSDLEKAKDTEGRIRQIDLQKVSLECDFFNELKAGKSWEIEADIARAKTAFGIFDKDGDGFLTKREFSKSMKSLSDHQIDSIFNKYDMDKDEKLSIYEFKNILSAKKRRSMKLKNIPKIQVTSAEYH